MQNQYSQISDENHLDARLQHLIPLGRLLEGVVVGDKDLLTGHQVSGRHDRHHQAVPGDVEEFRRLREVLITHIGCQNWAK